MNAFALGHLFIGHLPSADFWTLFGGAFSGVLGGGLIMFWQNTRNHNAKRRALLDLLAAEHATAEDSVGPITTSPALYLPLTLTAPQYLLAEGVLSYRKQKHRALLAALSSLQRATARFNRAVESFNSASIYPAMGASARNNLQPLIETSTKELVAAWGAVERAANQVDKAFFNRALSH